MTDGFTFEVTGFSTRTVRLTTGERVAFAPEALTDALRQVRERPVPVIREHLTFLPPLGILTDGEIRDLPDGEQQVVFLGESVKQTMVENLSDPFEPDESMLPTDPAITLAPTILLEPRNFSAEDFAAAREQCPIPMDEKTAWADLPPLEWLIAIPVTWGATKFAGAFLEHLGDAAGEALMQWIKTFSRKAKRADRSQFVTLSFDSDESRVLGFIPFTSQHESTDLIIENAINEAGSLAEIAGSLQSGRAHTVAYIYAAQEWHLAWWMNEEGVFISTSYAEQAPDPNRFL
jgi:hypothetical protein